jgi:hypothetical protein
MVVKPRAIKQRAQRVTRPEVGSSPAERLKQALAVLTRPENHGDRRENVTAAALCRLANLSRNSLYRYHPGILNSLRQYQRQHPAVGTPKVISGARRLRTENTSLHEKLSKLVALVDHYYSAYRETLTLLHRRDRELADLRRSLKSRPVALGR